MSHLGNFFRGRRIEKGLAFGQLARLLGYKNVSGGCNRIQAFERGGKVRPDLLGKLAEVLEVSDRILVLHEGRVMGCQRADEATQESLLQMAMS